MNVIAVMKHDVCFCVRGGCKASAGNRCTYGICSCTQTKERILFGGPNLAPARGVHLPGPLSNTVHECVSSQHLHNLQHLTYRFKQYKYKLHHLTWVLK